MTNEEDRMQTIKNLRRYNLLRDAYIAKIKDVVRAYESLALAISDAREERRDLISDIIALSNLAMSVTVDGDIAHEIIQRDKNESNAKAIQDLIEEIEDEI